MTNRQLYETLYHLFEKMIPGRSLHSGKKASQSSKETESKKVIEDGPTDFQFDVRIVNDDGTKSVDKEWYYFSYGEKVPVNDDLFTPKLSNSIAIDWNYDLNQMKYNQNNTTWFEENKSVKEHWDELNLPISLEQCIKWYTQKEILGDDDGVYCGKCQTSVKATKMMEVYTLPNFLILHLKRFVLYNNNWMKSNRLVNFPLEGLDPTDWLVSKPEERELYDLYATVNHSGRLGSGHYTSYAKKDGVWRCYNDNQVSEEKDPSSIVSPTTYLLFYKKRGVKAEDILRQSSETTKERPPQSLSLGKKDDNNKLQKNKKDPENCFMM